MGPHIIGLAGYAGSGKDALADMLVSLDGFERRAFADPMKEFLVKLNPLIWRTGIGMNTLENIIRDEGWDRAKRHPEIRELLQRLGTEAGRGVLGEDVWVNALFEKPIKRLLVISDVRFPNEAKAIKERGGIIIRVIRDGLGPANNHPSESAYQKNDYVIFNNGTKADLYEAFGNIWDVVYG